MGKAKELTSREKFQKYRNGSLLQALSYRLQLPVLI
jgi:hypothetical protein